MPFEPLPLVASGQKEARDWALALASAGIDCQVEPENGGWSVLVPPRDLARAVAVLEAYVEENPLQGPAEEELHDQGPTAVPLALAAALLGFWLVTGPRAAGSPWFQSGSAQSSRILSGEAWRAVTALTLHADLAHVAANAAGLVVFATGLCRYFGSGLAMALLLFAGTAGNLINALLRGPGHNAVGASTALFGAVGILAATQVVRRRPRARSRWRTWAPLGAGLALLAFLGSSPESDVLAHLFGFLAGAVLGIAVAGTLPRMPGPPAQLAMLVASVAAVAGAWFVALR
jgi:rhomboid protease GluP